MSQPKHSKLALLAIFVVILPVTMQGPVAPYLVPGFWANWFGAVEYCRTIGMQLVTIDSKAKNDAVAKFIQSTQTVNKYNWWIGGSDLAQKFRYTWVATGKPFGYANWSPNEPNNANNNEDCVHMVNQPQHRQFWTWNDRNCFEMLDFICERI